MRTTQPNKAILAATLLSLFLAMGLVGCGQPGEAKVVSSPNAVIKATILTIGTQTTPNITTATGTVRASLNTVLASKVIGRIVSVLAKEGDVVKAGQPLVVIDSRELQAAVTVADANLQASVVGEGSARASAVMEERMTRAAIAQAESVLMQSQAGLAAAEARRDQVVAGLRTQEVNQSHLVVAQAESTLQLARLELDRVQKLVQEGALAGKELDIARNRFDIAKGQYDIVLESEKMAREGSRSQEIRAAKEAVTQAHASVRQGRAAVNQARAAAMTVELKRKEVEVAQAQIKQASAAEQSARVALSYSQIVAPFDGRVVQRLVDPGAMANSGTPLMSIEGGEYRMEAIVPESTMSNVTRGSKVRIQIDATHGTPMTGTAVEIVPQGDPTAHTFVVKFSLGNSRDVKSGMFGRAQIQAGSSSRILIPETATWTREGLHYVYAVNQDNIAQLRMITIGQSAGGRVEVFSGLGQGDRIVTTRVSNIADGNKIEAGNR